MITAGAAAAALIAFLIAIAAFARMRSVTRPLSAVRKHAADAESVFSAVISAVENNDLRIEALQGHLAELKERYRMALQYVGLVRYNAFDDIAGQQSFSLCLLDGNKNGVLFSSLTGRNSTRSYAVTITSGVAERKLGDEEARAMEQALSSVAAAKSV